MLKIAWVGLLLLGLGVGALLWMTRAPGRSHRGPLPPATPQHLRAAARLRADVQMLAGEIGARDVREHPQSLDRAAAYITRRLGEAGYSVRRLPFDCAGRSVANLQAERRGARSPEQILVIGAHYDTVPETPGADDNASGAAVLLEIARLLAGRELARTVRWVAFVNEEPPWFKGPQMGSLVYARGAERDGEAIVGMISLEMLGYYDPAPHTQRYPPLLGYLFPNTADFVAFVGDLGARGLVHRAARLFRERAAFPAEAIAAPAFVTGIDFSDHWSFGQAGFPALMVTDTSFNRYDHYHEPTDTPERLDYGRMSRVAVGLAAVIEALANEP